MQLSILQFPLYLDTSLCLILQVLLKKKYHGWPYTHEDRNPETRILVPGSAEWVEREALHSKEFIEQRTARIERASTRIDQYVWQRLLNSHGRHMKVALDWHKSEQEYNEKYYDLWFAGVPVDKSPINYIYSNICEKDYKKALKDVVYMIDTGRKLDYDLMYNNAPSVPGIKDERAKHRF